MSNTSQQAAAVAEGAELCCGTELTALILLEFTYSSH